MKKKLPITKNKDVVVSWVYTWSKQQDMSIHEQRIVLRILEACQAELKGVKLKDYAGTKRKFEHGLWDVDADALRQAHAHGSDNEAARAYPR